MKQRERHDTENDALPPETEIYSKLKFVALLANYEERNVTSLSIYRSNKQQLYPLHF